MLIDCKPRLEIPPTDRSERLGSWVSSWKKTCPVLPAAFLTVSVSRLLVGSVPEMVIDLISVLEFSAAGLPVESSCLTTWIFPLPERLRVQTSPAVFMPVTEPASN